jgi:Tol biopolymer transport system component
VAVARNEALWTIDVSTGERRVVFRRPSAAPQLAGWSPDGRWLLFWPDLRGSASLASDGISLRAVPTSGGRPVSIATTLGYEDFVSWCGDELVATAGRGRAVTADKRVVTASAPSWSTRQLSGDGSRSWFTPACAPDGSRIAVTSTRDAEERRFDAADRSLWLLGRPSPRRLTGRDGDGVSEEFPRWSSDGRWLVFVRHASRSGAPAELVLARVGSGRASVELRVGRLSPQLGYYGHHDWGAVSDWYRPR